MFRLQRVSDPQQRRISLRQWASILYMYMWNIQVKDSCTSYQHGCFFYCNRSRMNSQHNVLIALSNVLLVNPIILQCNVLTHSLSSAYIGSTPLSLKQHAVVWVECRLGFRWVNFLSLLKKICEPGVVKSHWDLWDMTDLFKG